MSNYHYVFFVNQAYLLRIEYKSELSTISILQDTLFSITGVRPKEQVLLVNGGGTLEPDRRISDYADVGTKLSPMYMFKKGGKNDSYDGQADHDLEALKQKIEEVIEKSQRAEEQRASDVYLSMPMMARDCFAAAQRAMTFCARIYEEHELMNQAWEALMSNMNDALSRLMKKSSRFKQHLQKVDRQKELANQLLSEFDHVLVQLRKIMIPNSLLAHARGSSEATTSESVTMYDWILATDRDHSLEDLVNEVRELFGKFRTADLSHHKIETIHANSRSPDYREIKGIGQRLSRLKTSLHTIEEQVKNVNEQMLAIVNGAPLSDQSSLLDAIGAHKMRMQQIYGLLNELKKTSFLFVKSKLEVLNNIRGRLHGWIEQSYGRMQAASLEMVVFDEKFNGLKQRLELIRQIKEAPVIYATAVGEVIRRKAFQKEFGEWYSKHVSKCTALSIEEVKIREEFSSKLERHFLRVLFPGVFDALPQFFVQDMQPFDRNLGPLDSNYLRSLRDTVSELEEYLRVTAPQILSRLCISVTSAGGSQQPSSAGSGGGNIPRQESFFTPEATHNLASLKRNFPSSNWLSGDEVMDSSPADMVMAKSPPCGVGSLPSVVNMHVAPSLNQLSMLGEEEEEMHSGSVLAKSAPIQIPSSQRPATLSEKSSQFSTPEDRFEDRDDQFPVDDLTTRSQQNLEFLKPFLTAIAQMAKDLLDVRAEIVNNQSKFEDDFKKVLAFASEHSKKMEDKYEADLNGLEARLQGSKDELTETIRLHNDEKHELEAKITIFEERAAEREEEITRLRDDAVLFEKKLKDVKSDVFKDLTIHYELERDQMRADNDSQIRELDSEIAALKKEIEKKNNEIQRLKADPQSEEQRNIVTSEIRAKLEKEYKSRIDVITAAVEHKKDETVNKLVKEKEFDFKRTLHEKQMSMKYIELERDRLREFIEQSGSSGVEFAQQLEKTIRNKISEEENRHVTVCHAVGCQTEAEELVNVVQPLSTWSDNLNPLGPSQPQVMIASEYPDMVQSTFAVEEVKEASEEPVSVAEEVEEDDGRNTPTPEDAPKNMIGASIEVSTQTKIDQRIFDLMVSISDIKEGSTVLIIWDEAHNSYVLFSCSPFIHFVKESSVRRLGLNSVANAPRRNWVLGKVLSMDLCVIKKPENRYKLPVNSRVYRVDVELVELERSQQRRAVATPAQ